MTNLNKKRSAALDHALFEATMNLIPPSIGNSLLADKSFRERYQIKTSAVLNIGNSGLAIDRDIFVNGIKEILSDAPTVEILSSNGETLILEKDANGNIKLISSESDKTSLLPSFYQFSPHKKTRLDGFRDVLKECFLSSSDVAKWRSTLTKRPLSNEEFDIFNDDLANTPMRVAEQIRNNILNHEVAISDFVPRSKIYYERLIGKFDESDTVQLFTNNVLRKHIQKLRSWSQEDGLSFFLLTASHSAISTLIQSKNVKKDEIVRTFESLEHKGDPVSIIGAIEAGLKLLDIIPEIENALIRLIKIMRDDDLDESSAGIRLYSSIFMAVDGELSRLKLFAEAPPFYRRLASLSHAALIHRELSHLNIDVEKFREIAFYEQGMNFYMQTFTDMRIEPRWSPDMLEPTQVKADFLGRILIAAEANKKALQKKDISKIIYGDNHETIQSKSNFPKSYMPGPLEGAEGIGPEVPDEFIHQIEAQLDSNEAEPGQFFMLLNSALIYKIDPKYAQQTAAILKEKQYHLNNVEDRTQLINILSRLATLAAVTRSVTLADEILILLRVYFQDHEYNLTIDEYVKIGLEAAASRKDLKEWSAYLGNLFQDLAFSELEYNDGIAAYSYLECLCRCVPQLWKTCAKADAAFQAFLAIQSH